MTAVYSDTVRSGTLSLSSEIAVYCTFVTMERPSKNQMAHITAMKSSLRFPTLRCLGYRSTMAVTNPSTPTNYEHKRKLFKLQRTKLIGMAHLLYLGFPHFRVGDTKSSKHSIFCRCRCRCRCCCCYCYCRLHNCCCCSSLQLSLLVGVAICLHYCSICCCIVVDPAMKQTKQTKSTKASSPA